MVSTVELTFDYPVPASQLWACATDYAALAAVSRGFVRFDGLPGGRVMAGQTIDVQVRLFGWLPPQPYHMKILEFDETAMRVRSSESGVGVKSWQHRFQVSETPGGSRLVDHIEIDAGWCTPLYAVWARMFYKGRHEPRLKLLGVT